jgi:Fe-S-cluster containining protein
MGLKNKLHELYDRVPLVKCRGLCQEACGPIPATDGEIRIMERVSGKPHALDCDTFRCAYLQEGRCSIYKNRPLVCRIWGAAENLICPFGCKPDRYLTKFEALDLMSQAIELAGEVRRPDFFKDGRPATSAELQAVYMRVKALYDEG